MIEFNNIGKTYPTKAGQVTALDGIDLQIAAGEVFGIVGASGAGKSTLLRLINLLERPAQGELWVDGDNITALRGAGLRQLRSKIGMIFQHFNLLYAKTVAQNVAFPLTLNRALSAGQIAERVSELLARVGLAGLAHAYPAQLSGGQKQRVGIARALACLPKILLCDEATSALDPHTTQDILSLLAQINHELGITIVLITHEMDVVRRVCDRVAVLDGGRVVESGAVADLFLHPQHPVTRRFVQEALPEIDPLIDAALQQHGGRTLRLTVRGDPVHQPLLSQLSRDAGVDCRLLSGRIDRIKNLPYSQLVLSLSGDNADRAIEQLRAANVHVELLDTP